MHGSREHGKCINYKWECIILQRSAGESGAGVQTQERVSAQIIAHVMTTTIHQSVTVSVFSHFATVVLYLLFQAILCTSCA